MPEPPGASAVLGAANEDVTIETAGQSAPTEEPPAEPGGVSALGEEAPTVGDPITGGSFVLLGQTSRAKHMVPSLGFAVAMFALSPLPILVHPYAAIISLGMIFHGVMGAIDAFRPYTDVEVVCPGCQHRWRTTVQTIPLEAGVPFLFDCASDRCRLQVSVQDGEVSAVRKPPSLNTAAG